MKYAKTDIDIRAIREELGLSQSEFADLLAVSPRTIQSCEQQWRRPSAALEKSALLLLMAFRNGRTFSKNVCWKETDCDMSTRNECIAYRSRQGHLCWLMSGTVCKGIRLKTWSDKLAICQECEFFYQLLNGDLPILS